MTGPTGTTMVRGAGALTVAAALTATMGGCWSTQGGSGPPPPPTTATIVLTTSFASGGAVKCTAGPQWSATPVTVPPKGDGTATAVNVVDDRREFFPSGDRCQVQHTFTSLRPGRWRVSVTSVGDGSGSCETEFPAGTKFVGFGSNCPAR
ncbi:hypothetical protein [Actinoplanes nipponensis]|nr:hypothetical protein [Actinoplanes nipponensis]